MLGPRPRSLSAMLQHRSTRCPLKPWPCLWTLSALGPLWGKAVASKVFLTIAQPTAFILPSRWSVSWAFILASQIQPFQAHAVLGKLFGVYVGKGWTSGTSSKQFLFLQTCFGPLKPTKNPLAAFDLAGACRCGLSRSLQNSSMSITPSPARAAEYLSSRFQRKHAQTGGNCVETNHTPPKDPENPKSNVSSLFSGAQNLYVKDYKTKENKQTHTNKQLARELPQRPEVSAALKRSLTWAATFL